MLKDSCCKGGKQEWLPAGRIGKRSFLLINEGNYRTIITVVFFCIQEILSLLQETGRKIFIKDKIHENKKNCSGLGGKNRWICL